MLDPEDVISIHRESLDMSANQVDRDFETLYMMECDRDALASPEIIIGKPRDYDGGVGGGGDTSERLDGQNHINHANGYSGGSSGGGNNGSGRINRHYNNEKNNNCNDTAATTVNNHGDNNGDHDGGGGDDDDNEDDDDSVIVTLDLPTRGETERLESLLNADQLRDVPIICNKNYSYHVLDLEIEKELERLVRLSICPSTDKHVVILVNNQLILVPHGVRLSDRLASYVWGHHKPYTPSMIPYASEFNRVLRPNGRQNETFAIFGARYNNTHYVKNERNMCGLHQYSEFAAIIIQNNQIVDYAIHGHRSNIVDMIERHKPRRIYYNAKNASLGDFLEYKCQPFYQAFAGLLRPLQIHELSGPNVTFNPLSFCERNNIFCSLCRCLKDAYGFFNYSKIPATTRIPQRLKNFILPKDQARRASPSPSAASSTSSLRCRSRDVSSRASRSSLFELSPARKRRSSPIRRVSRHSRPGRLVRDSNRFNFIRASANGQTFGSNYNSLKRIRKNTDRFRGQRYKYKLHSFNANLRF